MNATSQEFQQIRDEAWKSEHADAMECRKCEESIERLHQLWNADCQFFASAVPGSPSHEEARQANSVLRLAEDAMNSTVQRALRSVAKGYMVDGLDSLLVSLAEARRLIALPIARLMAARDPAGRTAEVIAQLLVRRVRFQDGRPVITEDDAADLPCPFEPEPAL